MRRKIISSCLICIVLLVINSFIYVENTISGDRKCFLWKIQSKTNILYILGSIHFFKKELYPLDKKIEDSFEKSDVLVVEADINSIGPGDIQRVVENAFFFNNETLEKHVSKDIFEIVKKEFGSLGIPIELINKQKPWFLALTATSLELVKLGFDPAYGIDYYFLSKAQGKKRILELESLDSQISLLNKLSYQDQELFLLYTLKDLQTLGKEVGTLIKLWSSGDIKGMELLLSKTLREEKKMSLVFEKLVFERNQNMVKRIDDFLKTKETYFVVVGAGHLVGERGIIEILKKRDYRIEQM